ncbi:MAG: 50S ribosomal protein L15 [Pseudomonadota bacterium]
MRLNELRDNPGANKPRTRVGRGIGSGKGKTGGRGVKGQKSRSGVAIKGYEGGQMPIHMRLPKRGFNNPFRKNFALINLGKLEEAAEAGRIDATKTVTAQVLCDAGIIRRVLDGVRLVANGEVTRKFDLEVAGASATAIAAIEAKGGSVKVLVAKAAESDA